MDAMMKRTHRWSDEKSPPKIKRRGKIQMNLNTIHIVMIAYGLDFAFID